MKNKKFFNIKKIIFPFLGMIIFIMPGCMKDGDNMQYFEYVPAVVGYSYDLFQPTINTLVGTFLAPELQNVLFVELIEGDAILTSFYVNYDTQIASEYPIAYDVLYSKIVTGYPQSIAEGQTTGDFDLPIENMVIYGRVGNIWFFLFRHTAPTDQKLVYEMTYESNATDNIPVVSIRAKKDEQQDSQAATTTDYLYAFDMYTFFMTYKDTNNWVKFKIQYKTGVDDDGNDKYKDYVDSQFGSVIEFQIE